MEAYEAILTRRSVRAYTDVPVSEELIHKLLVAAMSAPSAGNGQPWHFGVITERSVLNSLAELLPFGKMLQQAPLAIVVCGETKGQPFDGYWVQDCSAATENLLLAVHALGMGAVWLGVYPREDRVASVRGLLSIPEPITPLCVVSVGYPVEPTGALDRFRAERVHHNQW